MVIETLSGKVEGILKNGLYQFLGIPYAKAKRFCPPEPVCWEGVLKADHFGKKAIQSWGRKNAESGGQIPDEYGEDCQNLNIYVPENAEKLPVAVYIHGGGFQNGNNQGRTGEMVIRGKRFLYVSINYRLGVLGYLYLGRDLGEQWQHTGNNGTLDQLAALKWVYENIEKFGGDRNRITVFGESAGAKTIGALLLRPEMQKYCSQVLMASGSSQCIRSTDTASEIAAMFFKKWNMCQADGGEKPVQKEDILTMNVDKLLEIQEHIVDNPGNTCMFGPVADGVVLPFDWKEKIHAGDYWSGTALIGSCLNENIYYKFNDPDFVKKAPGIAEALFGTNGKIAISEFEELNRINDMTEEQQSDLWVKIISDYMYRTYTRRLADQLRKSGCKVWYYSFEFGASSHCQDQGMAFHQDVKNDTYFAGIDMNDRMKMADIIYESYAGFFEKGDPNHEGIPEWKSLDEREDVMVWKLPVEIVKLEDSHTLDKFPDEVIVLTRDSD